MYGPPDPARTATTALFWDADHFGERGYGLIAEIYRHHLTWGWDRDDAPTGGPGRSHAAGGSGRSQDVPLTPQP